VSIEMLESKMNSRCREERLEAAREAAALKQPEVEPRYVNNHIHTTYSFSPYSPTMAVWKARQAGLATAGIMDHDSMAGGAEFLEAGRILNVPVTCGIELRSDYTKTPFNTRKTNNPDQAGITYMAIHGIPAAGQAEVQKFFEPYRAARGRRNRRMVDNINGIISGTGLKLDYDKDVLPISMAVDGGSVTERHILYALSKKLVEAVGKGAGCVDYLTNTLKLPVKGSAYKNLMDVESPIYEYDVLNVFKGYFVEQFFIPASDECPPVEAVLELSNRVNAISAYPYLGDVAESVTGDKKAQKFEDEFLEELLAFEKDMGVKAVAYMPTRNTPEQLARLRGLCKRFGFFEICGEDINQPRQSFICKALEQEEFGNLVDAAWAMIAHERLSDQDPELGMFSAKSIGQYPDIAQRAEAFAVKGRSLYNK